MPKFFLTGSAYLVLCCGFASADLKSDSKVDDVLDALNNSGKNLKSFSADLKETENDLIFDSTKLRFGKVWFQVKSDGNPVLHVLLDRKQIGDKKKDIPDKIDYLLDDGWLTTRTDGIKTEARIQTAPKGQKVNLFQLGKGPFPLPIGQDKSEVHRQFDVTQVNPAPDDPADTIHLLLVPKPGSPLANKFMSVDVWTNIKTQMPARIRTIDAKQTMEKTVDLIDLKVNAGLNINDLVLPPLPPDWKTSDTPMK